MTDPPVCSVCGTALYPASKTMGVMRRGAWFCPPCLSKRLRSLPTVAPTPKPPREPKEPTK